MTFLLSPPLDMSDPLVEQWVRRALEKVYGELATDVLYAQRDKNFSKTQFVCRGLDRFDRTLEEDFLVSPVFSFSAPTDEYRSEPSDSSLLALFVVPLADNSDSRIVLRTTFRKESYNDKDFDAKFFCRAYAAESQKEALDMARVILKHAVKNVAKSFSVVPKYGKDFIKKDLLSEIVSELGFSPEDLRRETQRLDAAHSRQRISQEQKFFSHTC